VSPLLQQQAAATACLLLSDFSERRQKDPEVPRLAGPVNSLLFGTNFAVARQLPSPAPRAPMILSMTPSHVNVELPSG
jgi:hypothetical protein